MRNKGFGLVGKVERWMDVWMHWVVKGLIERASIHLPEKYIDMDGFLVSILVFAFI